MEGELNIKKDYDYNEFIDTLLRNGYALTIELVEGNLKILYYKQEEK